MQCGGWEGPCESTDAQRIRMRTFYQNEESNYITLCPCCQKQCEEHWDEMWREYWSDKL